MPVDKYRENRLVLGHQVKVWRVLPYRVPGRPKYFLIDWPSYWNNGLDVEVGVVAVRRKNGRWKVVELELPEDISEPDAEDIVSCCWYVFEKGNRNRKCPPVLMVWEFSGPPVWVAACEWQIHERQVPFARQLKEIRESLSVKWDGPDLVNELRKLGPGVCTIAADAGILEFDILETGVFAERSFCPGCKGKPGRENDKEIVEGMLELFAGSEAVSVIVRTFTQETVCVQRDGRLVRVPVKEIRGYLVRSLARKNGSAILSWEKLPSEAVRESYCYDAATGRYVGMTIGERDHRFV